MHFEPGPGMGGHCLPVDPFYLPWRAREFDLTTEFIELAGKVNQNMPYHCGFQLGHALNEAGKPVKGQPHRYLRRQLKRAPAIWGFAGFPSRHPTPPEYGINHLVLLRYV